MQVKETARILFLLLFISNASLAYGQADSTLSDSVSFFTFLEKQSSVPGLSFRLLFPSSTDRELLQSRDIEKVDGVYLSGKYETYAEVKLAKSSLFSADSIDAKIQYEVFELPVTLDAAQKYVSNLLTTGELVLDETEEISGLHDFISLANRIHFLPTYTNRFGWQIDFKVFVIMSIIGLFFFVTIVMIVFMVVLKVRKTQAEKVKSEYQEQIVGPLSEILFEKTLQDIEHMPEPELEQFFPEKLRRNKAFSNVLINQILLLNKKMKGDFKAKLKGLYIRLQLDHISVAKLRKRKWDIIVSGLVEINEMDLVEALPQVKKHINSKNFYIRSQAVATLLNISSSVNLTFLREQTFPLSQWQQMNYLRIIRYLHQSRNLKLESLFTSDNQSIRMFGYKLVRILGRVDLVALLVEGYPDVTDEEKIEMLLAFTSLGVPVDPLLLNTSLLSDNNDLVIQAAKAAGVIGDENSEEVILQILQSNPSFPLRMTLLKSLKELNVKRFSDYMTQTELEADQQIHKHLLDPLLQDV